MPSEFRKSKLGMVVAMFHTEMKRIIAQQNYWQISVLLCIIEKLKKNQTSQTKQRSCTFPNEKTLVLSLQSLVGMVWAYILYLKLHPIFPRFFFTIDTEKSKPSHWRGTKEPDIMGFRIGWAWDNRIRQHGSNVSEMERTYQATTSQ